MVSCRNRWPLAGRDRKAVDFQAQCVAERRERSAVWWRDRRAMAGWPGREKPEARDRKVAAGPAWKAVRSRTRERMANCRDRWPLAGRDRKAVDFQAQLAAERRGRL